MAKKVVIIGGGHNGLVCACYLARAGADVTLLERRHLLGGAAVTESFLPGFRNSVASYTVSLLHPKIIRELHLHDHGLRILSRRINNFLPLPDGNALISYPDADRMQAELARFSERDARQWPVFMAQMDKIVPIIRDVMLQTPPSLTGFVAGDIVKLFRLSRHYLAADNNTRRFLLKLFSVSAGEMLDDLFESDAVKALLGFDAVVGNYGSPYTPGSAYVLLHHVVGETNGTSGAWGHAVGGMGAISDAIAREAAALGVRLETSVPVARVIVDKGQARGVITSAGDEIAADLVVANVNPALLYNSLLPVEVVHPDTLAHFRQYKCQSGTFRMNVALSRLPEFRARQVDGVLEGGIILAPSLGYMDRAYTDARQLGWSRQPIVEMLIPSLVDGSLAPEGQHVASLFCQQFDPALREAWAGHRDAAIRSIFAVVSAFAPDFEDCVLGIDALSPWDLEQKFGLIGGDIFHGRLSLDQLFSARPMLGMGQYQTDIKGLYLCGSGTHPGGGVSGIPGHNAAREISRVL
ncbi:MAG: phytoene desaturase family protein [Pseudomonadota bacterium]